MKNKIETKEAKNILNQGGFKHFPDKEDVGLTGENFESEFLPFSREEIAHFKEIGLMFINHVNITAQDMLLQTKNEYRGRKILSPGKFVSINPDFQKLSLDNLNFFSKEKVRPGTFLFSRTQIWSDGDLFFQTEKLGKYAMERVCKFRKPPEILLEGIEELHDKEKSITDLYYGEFEERIECMKQISSLILNQNFRPLWCEMLQHFITHLKSGMRQQGFENEYAWSNSLEILEGNNGYNSGFMLFGDSAYRTYSNDRYEEAEPAWICYEASQLNLSLRKPSNVFFSCNADVFM